MHEMNIMVAVLKENESGYDLGAISSRGYSASVQGIEQRK
jgi:hypothetical protein